MPVYTPTVGFIRVREMSEKLKKIKVRVLSGNLMLCQGKMNVCSNVTEMLGNFTISS